MQLAARAELVDYLPAGRTRALVRLGDDDLVLLVLKGSTDGQRTCEEMTELLQTILDTAGDSEGGPEWPPMAAAS
jgi:hypothetical protein